VKGVQAMAGENEKCVADVRRLGQFEPGGQGSPIDDAGQRAERFNSLSEAEKALAIESGRFADLCRYFSQKRMDIPPQVLDQLERVSKLKVTERAVRIQALNQELMQYVYDISEDPGIRQ
jgi:hypothetical protein